MAMSPYKVSKDWTRTLNAIVKVVPSPCKTLTLVVFSDYTVANLDETGSTSLSLQRVTTI